MATQSKAAAAKNDKSDDASKTSPAAGSTGDDTTSSDSAKSEDVVTQSKPEPGSVKTSTDPDDTQVPAPAVSGAATANPDNANAPQKASEVADFGPFQDTAPPVGAAVEVIHDEIDTTIDFEAKDVPFTIVEGDIYVAVRQHNNRNVVDIAVAGEVNSAKTLAPYQIKALEKALAKVNAKSKSQK